MRCPWWKEAPAPKRTWAPPILPLAGFVEEVLLATEANLRAGRTQPGLARALADLELRVVALLARVRAARAAAVALEAGQPTTAGAP